MIRIPWSKDSTITALGLVEFTGTVRHGLGMTVLSHDCPQLFGHTAVRNKPVDRIFLGDMRKLYAVVALGTDDTQFILQFLTNQAKYFLHHQLPEDCGILVTALRKETFWSNPKDIGVLLEAVIRKQDVTIFKKTKHIPAEFV